MTALFVSEPACGYRPATQDDILTAAQAIAAARLRNGAFALDKPEVVSDFLRTHLAHLDYEVFQAIFLDSQLRFIESREMFRGSVSQAAVYPREVVRAAMQCNASAVIVAHNHPSGVAEPSAADLSLTKQLSQAMELLDIRLLDHVIIAGPNIVSFAQRGLL
jgi:DNA repair protein RadC